MIDDSLAANSDPLALCSSSGRSVRFRTCGGVKITRFGKIPKAPECGTRGSPVDVARLRVEAWVDRIHLVPERRVILCLDVNACRKGGGKACSAQQEDTSGPIARSDH